jgi:tetratricopeptide (TPR) repeat protein
MGQRLAEKVLLVGWDSADWQIINSLVSAGLMPTLAGILDGGVMGNLSTLRPILSPMLWNSIATGKRADKHGILGFVEPKPDGSGIQPVSSTSRKTKALWNILTQNGLRSHVVGWYASHPAEPILGGCVSDHYAIVSGTRDQLAPVPPQSIHPPELLERLAELRVHPDHITPWHLAPFVPTLGQVPPEETPPITGLQKMLARCATVHAAATELMEHEPWDFMAVYYETIDHVCHGFMKYHPPRMDHIPEPLFERYREVVNGIYRYHDMMLQRLLQLAGEETTVLIVSDHGFLNDHLRPVEKPGEKPPGPEAWHRYHGMFAMKGPHILKDERIHGATLLDVAPTVLTLLGLPVGEDMDGKVLAQCFDTPVDVARVTSWDDVPGEAGLHPPDAQVDPFEQQAALQQLIDLGYVAAPGEDKQAACRMASIEARLNLAAVHTDAAVPGKAIEVLEPLLAETPELARGRSLLVNAYLQAGRLTEARRLVETMAETHPSPHTEMTLGAIELREGNIEKAMQHLLRAEQGDPQLPTLHSQIGVLYARQRRWADAERAFRRALEIDPDAATAHFGLGNALLRLGRHEEAAEHTLRAVGLQHFFPRAHLQLGIALTKLGWYDRAAKAFQTSISLRRRWPLPHRYLAALMMKQGRPDDAKYHTDTARRLAAAEHPPASAPGHS